VNEGDDEMGKVAEAQGLDALYESTVNGNVRLKIWVMLQAVDWGCDIKNHCRIGGEDGADQGLR